MQKYFKPLKLDFGSFRLNDATANCLLVRTVYFQKDPNLRKVSPKPKTLSPPYCKKKPTWRLSSGELTLPSHANPNYATLAFEKAKVLFEYYIIFFNAKA